MFSGPLCENESAGNIQRTRIDLYERVIHHAYRIVLRTLGVDPRSVRHRASRYAGDFGHFVRRNDGNGRTHPVSVQIEVDGEDEIVVPGYL